MIKHVCVCIPGVIILCEVPHYDIDMGSTAENECITIMNVVISMTMLQMCLKMPYLVPLNKGNPRV